jgi:lysophospholipase L1-like esterase
MTNLLSYCVGALLVISGTIAVSPSCTKNTTSPVANVAGDTTPVATLPTGAVRKYLALGDSYTIGQSVAAHERYPVQATVSLRTNGINMADAEIIATTGWTTLDLWNAIKDKPLTPSYDMVTLLIGVNNQYRGGSLAVYKTEFTSLLQRSIELAGNKPDHVIVISIPDYSVTPYAGSSDRERIAREIDSFNEINKQVADTYKVKYLNVTDESRKAALDNSLIAVDNLHFSGKEYTAWTALLVPLMMQSLQ